MSRPPHGIRFERTILTALGLLGASGLSARAGDDMLPPVSNSVEIEVPDPDNPGKTRKVEGDVAAKSGNDKVNMTTVAGVDITDPASLKGYELHFINVVRKDPTPPSWKDEKGKVHQVPVGRAYVDPLSGGNIPPGQEEPNPKADRKPPYDGERDNKKASQTGDFDSGEKKEYDLDDIFVGDPVLEKVYADAPTMTKGLEFTTYIVLIRGTEIYRLGGFDWGRKEDGTQHIDSIFSGAGSLSADDLEKALDTSGFSGFSVEIPTPGTAAMLGIAGLLAAGRKRH